MDLSNKLVKDFAKQIIDTTSEERENSITVIGTVTSVSEDGRTANVLIDGNTIETPVITTVDVFVDDRVNVMIKNRTATITNNYTHNNINTLEGEITNIGKTLIPVYDPPEHPGPEYIYDEETGMWYKYVPMVKIYGEDLSDDDKYVAIEFLDGKAKLSTIYTPEIDDWYDVDTFADLSADKLTLTTEEYFGIHAKYGKLYIYRPPNMGLNPENVVELSVDPVGDSSKGEIILNSRLNNDHIADFPDRGSISVIDLNADVVNVNGRPIFAQSPYRYDFSLTSHSTTGVSANNGSYAEGNFKATKAGYYPFAIGSFKCVNGSGSGSSYSIFNVMEMSARTTGSCTVNWRIRAISGNVSKCTITVNILWIKESEIKPSESTPGDPSTPVIPSYTNVAPYIGDDGYWYTYDVDSGGYINTEVKAVVVEEDPTVYDWAKSETKPSYTESEIGISSIETQEIDDMFELLF